MYDRPVTCGASGCRKDAEYKIAANWSAGRFNELKTYALGCGDHFAELYREALGRRRVHPPSAEETQGEIGIYPYQKGRPDRLLEKIPNPS